MVICVTFSCIIYFDVYLCLYGNLQTLEEIKLSSLELLGETRIIIIIIIIIIIRAGTPLIGHSFNFNWNNNLLILWWYQDYFLHYRSSEDVASTTVSTSTRYVSEKYIFQVYSSKVHTILLRFVMFYLNCADC